MAKVMLAGSHLPLDAVLVARRRVALERNPNVELRDHVILRNGPRIYKLVTHWVIRDGPGEEDCSNVVNIDILDRTKKHGWEWDPDRTIRLDDKGNDELGPLATFLGALKARAIPEESGKYLVVPMTGNRLNNATVRRLLADLVASDRAIVIAEAIAAADLDSATLRVLIERASANPDVAQGTAAALNIARFSAALAEMERLIAGNANEGLFQRHLEQHPWMFGSEYSELLDQRKFTRNEQQDFMMRRTVDGYLEVIEIKTPLKGLPLFQYDRSHDTYYPRRELAAVLGQVFNYLEKLDANRHMILAEDGEDISKVRAKVIIGCSEDDADQIAALRRLNGHLHRVEVVTFDQLVRMARRVLAYLEEIVVPLR
jgi:hypothetical protein